MLPAQSESQTITSFELFKIINQCREDSGETKIRANDFGSRVADELEGEHYETFVVQNPNKTTTTAYRLTVDQCMLVGMRESKSVRRKVLDKLKRLESSVPALPDFTNPVEAARAWADAKESEIKASKALEQARPSIEFVERYTQSQGSQSLTQAAKDLKFKPRQFTQSLERDGFLYRTRGALTPYQRHLDSGVFDILSGENGGHAYFQTVVTPKGKAFFAQRYASELLS